MPDRRKWQAVWMLACPNCNQPAGQECKGTGPQGRYLSGRSGPKCHRERIKLLKAIPPHLRREKKDDRPVDHPLA